MSDRETFLRAFHAASPGITSRVFARGGTYARLAEKVREALAATGTARILDLACGDGELLRLLGPRAIGLDLSLDELVAARPINLRTCSKADHVTFHKDLPRVQGKAQALPFADDAFDAATCHLAFMLFDDVDAVVAELARVLKPRAPFIVLLGGGPTADGRDAFHAFSEQLAAMPNTRPRFGDPRASTEAGWRELFAHWSGARDIAFERWPVDLGGSFDEVWAFLSSSYQLGREQAPAIADALRAEFSGDRVPCTVVTFCATVRR